jgi:hypothetical protein
MRNEMLQYRDVGLSALLGVILVYIFKSDAVILILGAWILLCLASTLLRKANSFFWKYTNSVTQKIGEFILMFFLFFFILSPIAVVYRFFHKSSNSERTNFKDVEEQNLTKEGLKRMW